MVGWINWLTDTTDVKAKNQNQTENIPGNWINVLFIFNGTTLTPLLHFGVKTNLLLLCLTEFLVKETLSYSVHLQVLVD